jgi:SAP domain
MTIETIARAKSKVFSLCAGQLTKKLDVSVPFTRDGCERRWRKLNNLEPIPSQNERDPFYMNDEFEEHMRNRKLIKDAEEWERQAKEAEIIAEQEMAKLTKANEAKRKAEEEVAKAEAILEKVNEAAKVKAELAAKKRAAAKGLRIDTQSPMTPDQGHKSGFMPINAVSNTSDDDMPISPSPFARKDRKKNLGVKKSDHRHRLTVLELEHYCRERGLGKNGTKADLMARLREYDLGQSIEQLRETLQKQGMGAEGTKEELIDRVAFLDASKSSWGGRIALVTNNDLAGMSPNTPTSMTHSPLDVECAETEIPGLSSKRAHYNRSPVEETVAKRPRVESATEESLVTPIEERFQH